ncbi:MAG: hypothetical protein H6741_27420 [Alphaproteobacteria bacterium]|nr:hypothetical protein [Alphaproteobacteria bacterium]
MKRALLPLLLAGCLPALPPPAHYTPDAPVSADVEPAVEAGVYLGVLPTAGGGLSYPLPKAPAIVLEGRGQVGLTHAAVSPGVWWRTRPEEHAGHHLGVRVGGVVGAGDFLGVAAFRMPYVGGTLGGQYVYGMPRPKLGSFSASLSVEVLAPILVESGIPSTDANGQEYLALPLPVGYGGLDLRWDIPLADRVALWLGFSADVGVYGYLLPGASLGARWTPSSSSAPHHSPP